MHERLIEFAHALRRNGLRVSLSEDLDALRAVESVGVEDPTLFRSALRAALVKRAADREAFEELFDYFFFGIGSAVERADEQLMAGLGLSPSQLQDLLEHLDRFLQGGETVISELARALLGGNAMELERLIREAVAAEADHDTLQGFRLTPFTRVAARLQTDRVQDEVERLKGWLREAWSGDVDQALRYVDQRLKDLYAMMREAIRQEQRKRGLEPAGRGRVSALSEKSFSAYTEEDVRRMNEAVARLAQRLKNRLSARRKKAARGRFNLKATVRQNLQFGGVPFRIELDRRKKTKPEVMILCDISDSVLNASRFMLQFVYSVQDLYAKVRSFVFVSDIGEVTRLFEEHGIDQAVERALKGEVIDVYPHSNFGRAFELFYKNYFSAITGKTTVLIIGDGRNNYNRPGDWVLREIQEKAKQLIWLNPESRLTWGVGDSEMRRYLRYCDLAEECRNIRQLYSVIDRIAP